MEFVILGDIHGRTLSPFEEYLDAERPERVYCTADFDLKESYREFLDITDDYRTEIVPGNHEHAAKEALDLRSDSLNEIGIEAQELAEAWQDSEYHDLLERVDDPRKQTHQFELNEQNAVLIHGALAGDTSDFRKCPENREFMWNRLQADMEPLNFSGPNTDYHEANFDQMEDMRYNVMFRSHDHKPEVTYRKPGRGVVTLEPNDGSTFVMRKERPYTVTTGAWRDGWFVEGDTEPENRDEPVIKYHKEEF
jgi:predicted phosphodiesterase